MYRAATRASTGMSAAKERLGKMWDWCLTESRHGRTGHGGGQGTQYLLPFCLKTGLQEWVCETHGKFWSKGSASVVEDQVREPLNRLRHIQVHGTSWDISLTAEGADQGCSWSSLKGEALEGLLRTGRRQMSHCIFRKNNVGNYNLISLIAITGKMGGRKVVSEVVSKQTVEKVVIRSSWHQFMKEKLCSISLITSLHRRLAR